MASSTQANNAPITSALLTDPKALKKHLANGTSISSHFEMPSPPARRGSEPLHSRSFVDVPMTPDNAVQQSKDDAYHVWENKGRKTVSSPKVATTTSSTFDPRQLLDPKAFTNDQRQRDSKITSTESHLRQSTPSDQQLISKISEGTEHRSDVDVNVNGLHKRDREDFEGQGMGSLIERVHNITQREERPQKKSKVQNDEFGSEGDRKVKSFGGSKGGEIGDYLKEKKKQGIAESKPVNAVVDLTGGTCHLYKHNALDH